METVETRTGKPWNPREANQFLRNDPAKSFPRFFLIFSAFRFLPNRTEFPREFDSREIQRRFPRFPLSVAVPVESRGSVGGGGVEEFRGSSLIAGVFVFFVVLPAVRRFPPERVGAVSGGARAEVLPGGVAGVRGFPAVLPAERGGGGSVWIPAGAGPVVQQGAVGRRAAGHRVLRVRDGAEQLHPVRGGAAAAERRVGVRGGAAEVVSAEVGDAGRRAGAVRGR